jgi:hypothetical protein
MFCMGSLQKVPDYIFPVVSNGDRVGKLCAVVEGTFMRMRDFFAASQHRRMRLSLPDSEVA